MLNFAYQIFKRETNHAKLGLMCWYVRCLIGWISAYDLFKKNLCGYIELLCNAFYCRVPYHD